MSQPNADRQTAEGESLAHRTGKLAAILTRPHYPGGDRAALKRWAPGQPPPLAFYRLWLHHLAVDLPAERQTQAWMAVAWGLAFMGPGANHPGRPLGRTLAEAGYSEGRLERLLASPEEIRFDLFASTIRFLAAKCEGFDWTEAARLLLTTESEKREALHRKIASDYYRTKAQGKE